MIDEQFTDNVLTKKKFTKLVEDKVVSHRVGYIDAVLEVCKDRELDPLDVSGLISPIIKDKIQAEAMSLNLIKGGNTLPL